MTGEGLAAGHRSDQRMSLGEQLEAVFDRHPILTIWAGWVVFLLIISMGSIIRFNTQDPDDYLRLLQVQDLLDGQSWFDVRQYRMNPPLGAEMHWSRLVDIPIAIAMVLFRTVLSPSAASHLAMVVVPLGQLLVVMALLWRLARELGASRAMMVATVGLAPLFPLLLTTFAPMRIDHHGWQAISALACGLFLVRAPATRSAVAGGLVAALWQSISLEGLPLVVLLAAIYGARFVFFGDRSVGPFLAGLAGGSWLAFAATRPLGELSIAFCDAVSWPHLLGFTIAAALTLGLSARPPRTVAMRAAGLGLVGLLAAAAIVAPLGVCAVNPFATLDPVMEKYWHGVIMEGLPITQQLISTRAMLVWGPVIVLCALLKFRPDEDTALAESKWLLLGIFALAANLVDLLVMRAAINAQILTVPFAALIVIRMMPRARAIAADVPRALATVALIVLATPTMAGALLKPADRYLLPTHRQDIARYFGTGTDCDLRLLNRLAPSHIFATMDLGPEILVRSPHTVVTSGYHRNMGKMREITEAFSGDPAAAEGIVRGNRADLVMLCVNAGDTALFRSRRPDNLANALVHDKVPDWLLPVPGFAKGELRLYRLR